MPGYHHTSSFSQSVTMIRPIRTLLLPLLFAAVALNAAGAQSSFVRDDAHSQINFTASSRMIDAQGYWDKWTATIAFDADKLEATTLALDIDAKSVNTRIGSRDNHLRSKDFFNADSFPAITFRSKSIRATGAAPAAGAELNNVKLIITGELTIRGVTKTVAIPATLVFFDRKGNVGRVKGAFTMLRKDYNISFDSPLNPIENEVPVQFDIAFKAAK